MAETPRVLLISPKTLRPKYQSLPMIGIAYIASYLRERGVEVDILDATVQDISYEGVAEYVSYFRPHFVGSTCIAPTYQSALRHLKTIKERHPDVITMIGGSHATALHRETIERNDFVDFCVRGEGEVTAHELVETLWRGQDPSRVEGITFKKDGKVISTPPRPYIKDLDALPYPALDLLPLHEYYFELRGFCTKRDLVLPFMVGRGCYGNCGFCAAVMMWGRPRLRSVDSVINELCWMRAKYGMTKLFSYDDLISANKKWLKEFCQKYIEAGLADIGWSCDARADSLDDDVLAWMKRANCRFILFGLEFGTQRLLDFSNKRLNLSKVEETIRRTRKHGIGALGSFIIGYPTETKEEILQTARFARKLHLDCIYMALAMPYPGTEMYRYCKEHDLFLGELTDEAYGAVKVPMVKLDGMTAEEIVDLFAKVHRIIKFSPAYIYNKLRLRLMG